MGKKGQLTSPDIWLEGKIGLSGTLPELVGGKDWLVRRHITRNGMREVLTCQAHYLKWLEGMTG